VATLYQLLEIPVTANQTQIRSAYKRLAFKYHPDLNPGNAVAEELFKRINEAYHILADPVKKARYDARLHSSRNRSKAGPYRSAPRPVFRQEATYRFDKQYFRIQGLTFLTFLVIAGFCFGVIELTNYFKHQADLAREQEQHAQAAEVLALYHTGKIAEAFSRIQELRQANPVTFSFITTHDSLLTLLRTKADEQITNGAYEEALHFLNHLEKYQPKRVDLLGKIAECHIKLENYPAAIGYLQQLLYVRPNHLEVLHQLGQLYLENLHQPAEALLYLSEAKQLFKAHLMRIYGEAYEVIMDPAEVPELYVNLFVLRARANEELGNQQEAFQDWTWAIHLRPASAELHYRRALIGNRLGMTEQVCSDLRQADQNGISVSKALVTRYCR
jgi:tetratricopeptide (TPR) repeat protein